MKKFFFHLLLIFLLIIPIVHSYSFSQYQGRCFPSGNIQVYESTNVLVANVTSYNLSGMILTPGCYLTLHRFNVPDTAGGVSSLNVGERLTFYIDNVLANTTPKQINWTGIQGPYDINISVCKDSDNDGYWNSSFGVCGVFDCNDNNQYIYPGNTNLNCTCPSDSQSEACDGKDNDCDGIIDNGLPIVCSQNSDCGTGACINGTFTGFVCMNNGTCLSYCLNTTSVTDNDGDGYDTECDNDCDDTKSNVYPGAAEACDGLDNDCDGTVDEGCVTPPPPPRPVCDKDRICDSNENCFCPDCWGKQDKCADGYWCSSDSKCRTNCTVMRNESVVVVDLFNYAKMVPENLNIFVETFDYWILDKYGNQQPVEVGLKSW